MSTVDIVADDQIGDLVEIVATAYPSFNIKTAEDKQRFGERLLSGHRKDARTQLYGLHRDGALLGGMRLFDFRLNLLGQMVDAGGVGMVAVDLLHKKEHVAKELIAFFLEHYRAAGAPIALLYPFRPDFYRRMGFGFGTKLNQYRLRPEQLPPGAGKAHVRRLTRADASALLACYSRYTAAMHGMIERSAGHIEALLDNADWAVVGYERDGAIEGYLAFRFKPARPDNFLLNDLQVEECVYETPAALAELLAFLRSQADQINTVLFNTQDEHFHMLLVDPRNGTNNVVPHVYHESNTQGVGLMYRVLDTRRLFETLADHRFGTASTTVRFVIRDSFFPPGDGAVTVEFREGRPRVRDGAAPDVEVALGVAEWSSLVVGATTLRRLHTYGLAEVSAPEQLGTLDALFAVPEKPVCLTRF